MRWIAEGALYGPGTVTARVVSESVLLLGGPRALLMQLAHPAVAAGVAEHSGFESDPFGRLIRTLDAMTTIAFGSPDEAEATLGHLRLVHEGVRGTFDDGEVYDANDPVLLLWVHATLVDTVLEVERRYLGLLDADERARYYDESRALARAFEIPEALIPPDLAAFGEYMEEQARTLVVGETARRLARAVLSPRLALVPPPLWEPLRLLTVDLLARPFREAYGLSWDGRRKRLLETCQTASRAVLPRVPRAVRTLPTVARRGRVHAS